MNIIHVDFLNVNGRIKDMNAVNNGPAGSKVRGTGNYEKYKALEIPYARLHDSAFYADYGGEYSVDVHRVFPDFDADETNPDSYLFGPTDEYLKNIESVGTKIFYRLGASIEHNHKRGTYPPKDFSKWARICEHIIKHYTEGWANGFKMNIEYWEIWNEADCKNPDGSNPCWQGTLEQYYDLYEIVAKHLKKKFPHLKIGGPAGCTPWRGYFVEVFLSEMKKRNAPVDFYSFHWYGNEPKDFKETVELGKSQLEKFKYTNTELHLNEWNYLRGWIGEEYTYTMIKQKESKGAAFVASIFCVAQNSPLDMLMYYDARPCNWNGLFHPYNGEVFKPYYSFLAFNELKRLGTSVITNQLDNIYSLAATNGLDGAILLSIFDEKDSNEEKDIKIEIKNVNNISKIKVEYYLLDEVNNLSKIKDEFFTSNEFNVYLKMKTNSVYLLKIVH